MKYKLSLFLWLTIILSACNNAVDSPYPTLNFTEETPMPFGRSSAVSFVLNGNGYVALGKKNMTSNYLNDCWEYNPITKVWTEKAPFPGPARVNAIADTCSGNVFIGLGFAEVGVYQDQGYLDDLWMYNPSSNVWTKKEKFPGKSTNACVSFVVDKFIYVGSGFNGWSFAGDFWKYNTETDKWSQLNDFPGKNRFGATLCQSSNHIYFGTGFRTTSENDWWEYFPANDSWKKRKSMPDNGRVNCVSLSVNNRFFIGTGKHFGGTLTGGLTKSDILEYDAVRNVWYERGNIPKGNRENAIAFVIEGTAYIGMGENEENVLSDLWSFKP